MAGIALLTIKQFQARIHRFDNRYVEHWRQLHHTFHNSENMPKVFGSILRKWQACRPNKMRRTKYDGLHEPPYLEDLLMQSNQHIYTLRNFCMRSENSLTPETIAALSHLWAIFKNLSYSGRARNGLAGIVGISKAVLLLTDGRVGPAFDAKVRGNLHITTPQNAQQWIDALKIVMGDIQKFEERNHITLQNAAPHAFQELNCGRIYDMALGPGS